MDFIEMTLLTYSSLFGSILYNYPVQTYSLHHAPTEMVEPCYS